MRARTSAGAVGVGMSDLRRRPAHREAHLVAGGDGEAAEHRRGAPPRSGTPERTAIGLGPPNVRAPSAVMRTQRVHEPVLGPRRQLQRELDAAVDALDAAQQLVRRAAGRARAALALLERQGVDQADAAGVGGEGGLEHERARQVATAHRVVVRAGRSTSGRRRGRAGARTGPSCRSGGGRASRSTRHSPTSAADVQSDSMA